MIYHNEFAGSITKIRPRYCAILRTYFTVTSCAAGTDDVILRERRSMVNVPNRYQYQATGMLYVNAINIGRMRASSPLLVYQRGPDCRTDAFHHRKAPINIQQISLKYKNQCYQQPIYYDRMYRCPSSNIPWHPLLLLCITYATKAILLIVIGGIIIRYYDLIPRSPTILECSMILYHSSSPTPPPPHLILLFRRRTKTAIHFTTTKWYDMDLPTSIGYINKHTRRILAFVVCVALVIFVVSFFLLLFSTVQFPNYWCCRTFSTKGWWITNYQHTTRLIGYRFLTSSSQSLSLCLLSCQILLYVNEERLSNSCCRLKIKGEEREINKFKFFS